MVSPTSENKTDVGNYFVSNYPPFSQWRREAVPDALKVLSGRPQDDRPLGLYLHIPFCRKRCKFCYFRVYTDKNGREVETYIDALEKEIELYSRSAAIQGRPLRFVYFGGGTPSFLSADQLRNLVERIGKHITWDNTEEVTFECEPGTLRKSKLETLKDIGVTRLSLGVENFDDHVLEINGRAHLSPEIDRAYGWARQVGFDQINLDLIAGMVGETEANWRKCVRRVIEMAPESVTIYQMELPYNTLFSRQILSNGEAPVADWETKRAWVKYAFNEMAAAGYEVSSGYTMVRDKTKTTFEYRDSLWHGADMVGTGVASFSHVQNVHYQNVDGWDEYIGMLNDGELPLNRAMATTEKQRLIREFVLQMKLGILDKRYFADKFGKDITVEFAETLEAHRQAGMLNYGPDEIRLTEQGLLQVDGLLPLFFEPEHQSGRYT
jgi:oxygen-independent coproporphyrinogen-3 oxidase